MSRTAFVQSLHAAMQADESIVVITADLGFGVLDAIRRDFPTRFFNCGAAEMLMVGMAIGFAQSGFKPVCYSITSFVIYRPFEMIRTYLDYENINVKLVGVGRNKDYVNMGKSHWADDDERIMSSLLTLRRIRPSAEDDMSAVVKDLFETSGPAYINLLRT